MKDDFFDFNMEEIQKEIDNAIAKDIDSEELLPLPPLATPPLLAIDDDWHLLLETADPMHGTTPPPQATLSTEFYRENIKSPPKNWGSGLKKAVAILLICTLGTGGLGFGIGAGYGAIRRQNTPSTTVAEGHPALTTLGHSFEDVSPEPGTLADIVELLTPSVVGITSRVTEGFTRQGSGLIFAEDEQRIFIVTNQYVVQGGGNRFEIAIEGNPPLIGRPVGSDSSAYLAVLSIDKADIVAAGIDTITIATFGDSDAMRVGDTVIAIGNAMGYGNSVTRGVISASEQRVTLPAGGHELSLLQTDAAINYGNSGGPLINTRGEVIGINFDRAGDLIFGRTSVEGMGFSISSNIVAPLLDDLITGRRPALGISGGTISEQLASQLNIPSIGVYVSGVTPGRAAANGGMMPSDVITGFNGQQVFNWAQLVYAIRGARVGDTVEIRVLREGTQAVTLYVELDAMVVESF